MEDLVSNQAVCMELFQKISGNRLLSDEQDIVNLKHHFSTRVGAHAKVSYSIEDTYNLWPDSFKFIYQTILKSLGGIKILGEYKKRFNYELVPLSDHKFHIYNGRVTGAKISTAGV